MEDDDSDIGAVAELGSQIIDALTAETVTVKLRSGKLVEGSLASFVLRKKTKKGEESWSGKLSVETDSGVLEMECSNVASVKANR